MCNIIFKDQLKVMSNDELLAKTKDRAVNVYIFGQNHSSINICFNDLLGFDISKSSLLTRTGIKVELKNINYIEIV